MSAPQMTTAEALRSAIAETLSIDAQGLQAAIGQLVVATSAECPDAGPDAHSLCDPQTRTTVLLADRIPAGQEAAAVAREIERHHGRQAAQAVLGARASELLGDDGKVTKQLTVLDTIAHPVSRIGGSILPSSDPTILKPLNGLHGVLQVRPILEADTYGLFFTGKDGTNCLAQHSNGYSCHNLAVRLVDVWSGKREPAYALAQFDYILSCGGLGKGRESIAHIAAGLPEASGGHDMKVSNCIEPSPSRASGHTAYEATEEDVENVLRSNSLAVAHTNGKSFESMANELHGKLDFDLIEQAALAGDDLDEQTDYANDEIARQLREMGVLEPLKPAYDSPSPGM